MCSFENKNNSRFLAAVLEPSHADYRQAQPLRLPRASWSAPPQPPAPRPSRAQSQGQWLSPRATGRRPFL